mgnify:CR=1 FL=1
MCRRFTVLPNASLHYSQKLFHFISSADTAIVSPHRRPALIQQHLQSLALLCQDQREEDQFCSELEQSQDYFQWPCKRWPKFVLQHLERRQQQEELHHKRQANEKR